MKKLCMFILTFSIGCGATSVKSTKSYYRVVRDYNEAYRVIKIMPEDKYVVVMNKDGKLLVLAIDKVTKEVICEYKF